MSGTPHIRVTFVQPSLAHYRVPFFKSLAQSSGLQHIVPTVWFAQSSRRNAEPDGFAGLLKPVRRISEKLLWFPAQLAAARRDVSDVAVYEWNVHYLSLVPALLRARRNGVKTILWGHGTGRTDGTLKSRPRDAIARLADALVFYSRPAADRFIQRAGARFALGKNVFVAPNALDLSPIRAERDHLLTQHSDHASLRRSLRVELDLGPGPILLFISRVDPPRRVDLILDAMPTLIKKFPNLKLAIVGDGSARPGLETQIERLNLGPHIAWPGAIYDEPSIARWMLASDVMVFPSYMGLSAIHAMAYGLPVIAGDDRRAHGPEAEAIVHEQTGLRFPHNDPIALSQAIDRLLTDETLKEKLSQTAREQAHKNFDIPAMADGMIRAITRIASTI
jgi:glycosyltransferase involved in cell wall biosynthesis